jgi:3-hydroxy-9,10-secoandrosta-1,3,5(10)-triene-9,17-dione monooxygenase reductase component
LGVQAHTDSALFRQVLGHFCTGVTVITTTGPVGFACQAFAALSLDPPLVTFCPGRESLSWRAIEREGHFGVNVLAESQQEVSRTFGTPGVDKFADVGWTAAPSTAPVLDGVLTWLTATVEAVHSGGDHLIVVGRVTELGPYRDGRPLLFYRGRYTSMAFVDGPPEPVGTLLAWPRHDDWI